VVRFSGTIGPVLPLGWVLIAAAAWLVWAELSRRFIDNPRREIPAGMYWTLSRWYAHAVHGLRAQGQEGLRRRRHPGPLIIVVNHTAGVDPVLVQSCCDFEIRWVMAQDMRAAALEDFWSYGRIIFVDRQKGGMQGTREIVAHVKGGGVIGIFPEGRIERPGRTLLPFEAGVGFVVRQTGAPVLPVWVDGTPGGGGLPTAWASLVRTSRSVVRFGELIDYSASRLDAAGIAADLRRRYREWTGWPVAEPVKEGGA
jgi:1-acyl-sn-glycerol-3-phosphate acyltransferase